MNLLLAIVLAGFVWLVLAGFVWLAFVWLPPAGIFLIWLIGLTAVTIPVAIPIPVAVPVAIAIAVTGM